MRVLNLVAHDDERALAFFLRLFQHILNRAVFVNGGEGGNALMIRSRAHLVKLAGVNLLYGNARVAALPDNFTDAAASLALRDKEGVNLATAFERFRHRVSSDDKPFFVLHTAPPTSCCLEK